MSTPADLSRPLPTAATEAREEKLVESKGVEPLADLAPGPDGAGGKGGAEGASSAPAPAELIAGPQTLLDAAQAAWVGMDANWWSNLGAAIAREKSRGPTAEELASVELECARRQFSIPDGVTVAQAMLGLARRVQVAEVTRDTCRKNADEAAAAAGCAPHDVAAAIGCLLERAKKAEAELAQERRFKDSFKRDSADVRKDLRDFNARLAEVVPMAENPIDTARKVVVEVHALRENLKKAEAELAAARMALPRADETAPATERLMAELSSLDCSPQLGHLLAGIIEGLGRCADPVTVQRVADHTEIALLRGDLESAEADAKEFSAEIDEVAAALSRWKPLKDSVGHAVNELVSAHAAAVAELEKAKAFHDNWQARANDAESALADLRAEFVAGLKAHAQPGAGKGAGQAFTGLPSAKPKPFFGERPPAGGSRPLDEAELASAKWRTKTAEDHAETLKRLAGIDVAAPCTVRVRSIPGGWEIELGAR